MTPTEQLNRASETLLRLAEEARIRDDSEPWKYDAESGRITSDIKGGWDAMSIGVVCDYGLQIKGGVDGYNHASGTVNQDSRHGEFIALMDPDLARMLAAWLAVAGSDWSDQERPRSREALALAEHINERASNG